ncbi:MAG: MYG1 family protein [Clostridia bacterium]|nr:MYG1 family protein [Clostridia bacterium]
MVKLVKDVKDANFVTHAGKFHADEVFGTILLEKIFKNVKLIRLPEVDNIDLQDKIVYDIGGGEFDHHQLGGNGQRESGIKYAAFGLLWKKYGKEYFNNINVTNIEDCFRLFDKNFVQFIDAGDNGQIKYENIDIKLVTLSDIIEGFNPNWNEEIDTDEKFIEALSLAKVIFDNKIESTISKCSAKKFVEDAIEKSENGIMILEKYMPYQEFILESKNKKANDILYVIFKSNRKGYTVRAVAKELGSFECRKKFPKEWAGLRNEDLQKVTGVKTATFCHNACFICVADKFEDAIKLANFAVESGD